MREPPLGWAMLIGAAMGLLAGLTGVGGGIFLSPLLLMLGWAGTKQTSAVAAPFILVNSLAGLAAVFVAKSAALPALRLDPRAGGAGRRLAGRRIRQPALRQSPGAPCPRRGAGARRREDDLGMKAARLVGLQQLLDALDELGDGASFDTARRPAICLRMRFRSPEVASAVKNSSGM